METPGYAGVPVQQKAAPTSNTNNCRGEYAMLNTLQSQQQTQQFAHAPSQSDFNGGYRAPSMLNEAGRSINGSIGNGSTDGRLVPYFRKSILCKLDYIPIA